MKYRCHSCGRVVYESDCYTDYGLRCPYCYEEIDDGLWSKDRYEPEIEMHETPENSGGCYVATAVYGSYDCPQVWTLRRYRDFTLSKTWYGRAFIHTYYAISPTIVKWFGNTNWFNKLWRGKLDKMVSKLQSEGVESTPYIDIDWRRYK